MTIFRRFGTMALLFSAWLAVGCSSEVKVGAVISETGAVAAYGRQVTRGLDLALEEINDEGGFKGSPVTLIYRNDATNPEVGEEAVRELIEKEGVKLVIGAISSPVTMAIGPICEKNRVVLLSPTSSAPRISELGEYVFRNYPSDILEGTAMADLAKNLGVRRAVIFALDNEFGNGLTEVFSRRFESKSRKVVETFRIKEDGDADLATMVEQLKELEPQGIYIVAYVDTMAKLLKLLDEAEIDALVMGSGSVTEQLPRLAGEAADQFVYSQPSFDPESTDPVVSAFVQAYNAKYGENPDIYAAHGYDSLKLIIQAIKDTGFAYPDEVKRGLLGLKDYTGAAGRTDFDERGDVVRYPTIFVIHDGESMPYDQFEQAGHELPTPGRK